MASELISKWQELEVLKKALQEQITGLGNAQRVLRDAMPKIWYVEGFGNNGFQNGKFCFSDDSEVVKAWLESQGLEINNARQFYPNDGAPYHNVSGLICFVTPVDVDYDRIKALYEAQQAKEGK